MSGATGTVCRILTADEWAAFRHEGSFAGAAPDRADGFIHLSSPDQVAGTLAAHFAGAAGLMLLELDAAALGDAIRWEASRGGARFPHLYSVLPLAAVVRAEPISGA